MIDEGEVEGMIDRMMRVANAEEDGRMLVVVRESGACIVLNACIQFLKEGVFSASILHSAKRYNYCSFANT